jgi:predicted ArsR family transcriptional regulator
MRRSPIPRASGGRFAHSTQARLLELLRQKPHTVAELATALALTPTGVRIHLAAMERDGLVQVEGSRVGTRKPSHLYGITPKAEAGLSRAYLPLLISLVGTITENLPHEKAADLFEAAGRRLGKGLPRPGTGPQARSQAALKVLRDLGGAVRLETSDGRATLVSSGCPVAEAVRDHPEVCQAVRSLLSEVTGRRVTEQCERGVRPRCRFGLGKDH